MFKRHIKNAQDRWLVDFFTAPRDAGQRRYELVRAIVMDGMPVEDAAEKFHYQASTVYALLREAKGGRVNMFPVIQRKRRSGKIPSLLQCEMVKWRDSGMSAIDIRGRFSENGVEASLRTVERARAESGCAKLARSTKKERRAEENT